MSEDFKVLETQAKVSLVWKVNNFLSLPKTDDYSVDSPKFFFHGEKWFIRLYPNGEHDSTGWLSLFLIREFFVSEKLRVAIQLEIRTSGGGSCKSLRVVHEFKKDQTRGYGWPTFIKSSELYEGEGVVSDEVCVTIFCRVQVNSPRIEDNVSETALRPSLLDSIQMLQQNIKDLFENVSEADVTIKVKDRKFQAHRLILMARSPVFSKMFEHDSEEKRTGIVDITDCDPESFKDFLSFLYTGELDVVSISNAVGLYKTADKYDRKDLKCQCVFIMSEKLSVKMFCVVVLLATTHDETKLLQTATNFFRRYSKEILQTSDWKELEMEHVEITNNLLNKKENKKL